MAETLALLVDTDIFIEYFNHRLFRELFENRHFQVFYSVVTKKELLSKIGLSDAEKKEIRKFLKGCRMIPLKPDILDQYSKLRKYHPSAAKEDCLIAASAIVKRLPLVTRNYRHFRIFEDLKLYFSKSSI